MHGGKSSSWGLMMGGRGLCGGRGGDGILTSGIGRVVLLLLRWVETSGWCYSFLSAFLEAFGREELLAWDTRTWMS